MVTQRSLSYLRQHLCMFFIACRHWCVLEVVNRFMFRLPALTCPSSVLLPTLEPDLTDISSTTALLSFPLQKYSVNTPSSRRDWILRQTSVRRPRPTAATQGSSHLPIIRGRRHSLPESLESTPPRRAGPLTRNARTGLTHGNVQ